MKYSLMTDKGIIRPTNQDSCFVSLLDADSCLAVVCDGMGGSNAGDIASDIAVKTISERITAAWRAGITAASAVNLLTTAITAANICIYDYANENKQFSGMGTTVVAAIVIKDSLVVAHAGDSRAYLFGSQMKCITKDHSLVQDMVDAGRLTAEQARFHPDKNYITRALGIEERVEIDFSELPFDKKDKLLLCSDGLTNFVSESKMSEIMSVQKTEDIAEQLIREANNNGGGDNITAVVISK